MITVQVQEILLGCYQTYLSSFVMTLKGQSTIIVPQTKKRLSSKFIINYEILWQVLFVFISAVSALLINKIYLYQTLSDFKHIRKGNTLELLLYGIPSGIIFITLENLFHIYLDNKIEKHYINHDRYKDKENRINRCYKLAKWIFSLFYYSFTSIFGYLVIKNTSFMPTWLGGHGQCTDLGRYLYSLDEANVWMKCFYIMQFGKHLCRLVQHCFFRVQGNFYEYALHHGLSTFLIFFSYLMNMWLIGIFVLLIHDISDIALIFGRGYRDCKKVNMALLLCFDVVGVSVWMFCRIFLLSYCCVYSSLSTVYEFWRNEAKRNDKVYEVLIFPGVFMGFMLFSLLILQVFWTYKILTSVITVTVKKDLVRPNE